MRDEIRLGNEALARNKIDLARQHFQELLDNGGTPTQERIATNRLREIHQQQKALSEPQSSKPRARRKTTRTVKRDDATKPEFVRPPEKPLVVIKRH
jgi:hypothetical protein